MVKKQKILTEIYTQKKPTLRKQVGGNNTTKGTKVPSSKVTGSKVPATKVTKATKSKPKKNSTNSVVKKTNNRNTKKKSEQKDLLNAVNSLREYYKKKYE